MKLILQGSLEIDGVSYEPGDEVDIPEEIYDRLVETYIALRDPIIVTNDTLFEWDK